VNACIVSSACQVKTYPRISNCVEKTGLSTKLPPRLTRAIFRLAARAEPGASNPAELFVDEVQRAEGPSDAIHARLREGKAVLQHR
jgi:hypothetical protein